MSYFEYLRITGKEDGPESYADYLIEICGYDRAYAKSMADLQFQNR